MTTRLSVADTATLFARAERFGRVRDLLGVTGVTISNWRQRGIPGRRAKALNTILKDLTEKATPNRVVIPHNHPTYWKAFFSDVGASASDRLVALEVASVASDFHGVVTVDMTQLSKRTHLSPLELSGSIANLAKGGFLKVKNSKMSEVGDMETVTIQLTN